MEVQSNARAATSRSLLDDPDAWAVVREWASESINFPTFDKKMQDFGDRYVLSDWNSIYNRVFDLSEDGDAAAAVSYVEDQMESRGLVKQKGKRKAGSGEHRPRHKKRARRTVNSFLDVEARVDEEEEEESSNEGKEDDDFIVPEDTNPTLRRDAASQLRVYPVSERAGPSTYLTAVDRIANRFLPSTLNDLDDLDDEEYNRQLDHYAGRDDPGEGEEEESDAHQVLEPTEIWNSIRDWTLGTQDYYMLVELIDYQYDFDPKIQYWEDFLSKLAFLEDLDKRAEYFRSISLEGHLRRLVDYQPLLAARKTPPAIQLPLAIPQVEETTPRVDETPRDAVWAVKVVPRKFALNHTRARLIYFQGSSAAYIADVWKNVGLDAKVDRYFPGRVTVCAPYPNVFLHTVPPSHCSCIRGWSLIPVEDRIPACLFGWPTPSLPTWYTVSKRGIYKGDIAYALDFNSDTMELHILLAPRRLSPKKRHTKEEGLRYTETRRLFSPEEYRGQPLPPRYGLPCYRYKEQIFLAGLLLMRVNISQVVHLPAPSPQQIGPHVASRMNPSFMKKTYEKYNQKFWKPGDRVTISDSTHLGKHGNILTIDRETESAVVVLSDGPEHPIPLSLLSRLYRIGDGIRVIEDPYSNDQSACHGLIGRCGLISRVDCETGEATVTEGHAEFQVSQHLLESHSPDQQVWAPVGVLNPSIAEGPVEQVQIGDMVEVRHGPHTGKTGFVFSVERPASTLSFVSSDNVVYKVPTDTVSFTPDRRTLQFSPERGYDVRQGDTITVLRGDYRGVYGTATKVCLESKVLEITPLGSPGPALKQPITYCAHTSVARDHDENRRHLGKEVLIVHGEFRGWRGTLRSLMGDKCIVARGLFSWNTYSIDNVIVRGSQTRLSGRALTPQETLMIAAVFARAETSSVCARQQTPPPSDLDNSNAEHVAETTQTTASNPWEIDENDREILETSQAVLDVHKFLLHPNVLKPLENLHAVFQITGGQGTYVGRLAKTQVPSPLHTEDGPIPKGHIAVLFTARTKGARLLKETMSETVLKVYSPVKKNTFCMVIQGNPDGEPTGSVLFVTRVFKGDKVAVQRLDGTRAAEEFLPMSRVIVVEPRS
ncbi:hypothetical protein J3R83DRAFT_7469 [Lanmaoa asiatica]|nr:hypothetical protein J3R83DRAFT_7469 [Lanmaoa asiatica]